MSSFAGINAVQILSAISDIDRCPSENLPAAEAGVVQVAKASDKSRALTFRYACNKRLLITITT